MARWRSYKEKATQCFYCWRSVAELRAMGIYMTVDHVLPKDLGGTNDYNNLVTACERCNNAKDNNTEWYAGCVALEGHGRPEWYKRIAEAKEWRKRNDR